MTTDDERDVIDRIARGDRAAMGELLHAHEQRLYNVCFRMVRNRDDAAELTQDAMVKMVQHLDGFRGEARLTTWMTRIAMNLSLSFLRKRKLRSTVSLNGDRDVTDLDGRATLVARLADDREPQAAQRVELKEELEALHAAIGRLDPDFRAVLVLRDLEQLDYRQIGETLELQPGTVKSRLFRARLALREQMQNAPAAMTPDASIPADP